MKKDLIIVESPAKARTINKYLGLKYKVVSSKGHLIDLPKSRLGIDIENNFKPEYKTIHGKTPILNELKTLASQSKNVFLAADPDREGEAISFHLSNALRDKNSNVYRIIFNEITNDAIREALANPRQIDMNKVNAQQARRILDRLVGYNLSPLLWKKVKNGLSAGRVQSVALRIIIEREKEIENFNPVEYWSIEAEFIYNNERFKAKLIEYKGEKVNIPDGEIAKKYVEELKTKEFKVSDVQIKEKIKNPYPPYITSKLQQDGLNKLNFSVKRTMQIAQQLYEGIDLKQEGPTGLITYMRTDSFRVSSQSIAEVRQFISNEFGSRYLPLEPNYYRSKKGAQDAHEAIRPTSVQRTPESIRDSLDSAQYKLYQMIWLRFVASQMAPAKVLQTTVKIQAGDFLFQAIGSVYEFDGWTRLLKEREENRLPDVKVGAILKLENLIPSQHFTEPPPRYTEATLVKVLEEFGIGRPSTYAPTINTLLERFYIIKNNKQLVPTDIGKKVLELLVAYFPELVNIEFTASMEEKLDEIEDEQKDWVSMLKNFYQEFERDLKKAESEIEVTKVVNGEKTDEVCEKCGSPMLKKLGKFGYFLACAAYPKCKNAKPIPLGECPLCDGKVVQRRSKRGRFFYACTNYPKCSFSTWDKVIDEKCSQCGKILVLRIVQGKKSKVCLKEGCGYTYA